MDSDGDKSNGILKETSSNTCPTPWHWWVHLSSLAADITDALGVVLELPEDIPDESVINRWFSEPIVCILIPTSLFLTNAKGLPVLPRSHQYVIRRFFKVSIVLDSLFPHDVCGV